MDHAFDDLGTRVLNAARLAVAMHLSQSAAVGSDAARNRQVMIGGAGPHFVTDDTPNVAPANRVAREDDSRATRSR